MLETAQDIIDSAFGLIGVYSTGNTITPEEYQLALKTLNRMVDRFNLSDLLVYSTNPHTFPFVPGQQSYNLGTGGDFDMPRPSKIEAMSIILNNDQGSPMELPIDVNFDLESWQHLVVKNIPSTFPVACYNNTGFPYMLLNFWPVPTVTTSSIKLYTWDLMPFINNLNDMVELPTGYSDAIVYNLAIRLAQLFDRPASPELVKEAALAKHDINDINAGTPTLHIGSEWGQRNNGSLAAQSIGRVVL